MKILGKTDDGFIVQISKDEVAQLRGFKSNWDLEYDRKKTMVGSSYEVSLAWVQLEKLRKGKDLLSRLAKEVRLYADLIEYKEPVINREAGNEEEE